MGAKPLGEIIQDFESHIVKNGSNFAEWFVGVTDTPKHTLFTVHKVKQSEDSWISRRALDDLKALDLVEYFQTVRKTKGDRSKTSLDHVIVYAYRIKPHTRQ